MENVSWIFISLIANFLKMPFKFILVMVAIYLTTKLSVIN